MTLTETFIYYAILGNVITFIVFGIDKLKAKKRLWRIPEATLLLMTLAGGSIGAWCGMIVWRHKTRHWKFRLGVPAIFILHVALIVYFCKG